MSITTYIAPALVNRCRVIKLSGHKKKADETSWQDTRNYSPSDPEVIEHISTGQNYGIIPINSTIAIDCDTDEMYENLPEKWKSTLTVITGRGGHHLYLDCKDSPKDKIILFEKTDYKKSPGDIRGSDSAFFTVGAGSIHPDTGKKYVYKDPNAQIISVTWGEIKKELISRYATSKSEIPIQKKIAKSNTGSLSDKLGLRIEDFAMPDNAQKKPNGEFQGSHPIHGSTTGMNFSINPHKNVWHCFRCGTGGDPVSWIAYAHCNVAEDRCNNLSKEEFKDVINWLKDNGYEKEIERLGDEYHSDPSLPSVDLTDLLKGDNESDVPDIEDEITAAMERSKLPPFPELDSGLFKDYVDLGKRVSYSLEEFHFAALLAVASMAIGRKVVIKVGMTNVYPNVFVMVVGQTTISGKSVACNMAVDSFESGFVYEEPLAKCYSTNIVRNTISEAALIQGLNDIYNSLWYWDDCNGFFEDAATWNAHILGTMCSIYDGSKIERTLSKRSKSGEQYKWSCPSPYLSLLFNTTTKDIEQIASSRLFSSGFFPRMMWFYGQGGHPRKNHDISEDDLQLLIEIKNKIKWLREALAQIQPDGIVFGVCDTIEDWKITSTMNRLGKEDESFRTAISRAFIHAYKIAVVLTMFDPEFQKTALGLPKYPISAKIPDKHARMAIRIVEQYLIPRTMYVCDMCNNVDIKNHQIVVMKAIDQCGGVSDRTKLLRQTHLGKKELDQALATLVESNEIKMRSVTKDGNKKPTIVIIKQ
jgi:hypothetical protein